MAVIIPPRSAAVPSTAAGTTPSQRDQHMQMIQVKERMGWQKAVNYGRRSLAKTAMFRFKAIIGSSLRARTLPAQKTKAKVACSALNRRPSSACRLPACLLNTHWAGASRPRSELCTKAQLIHIHGRARSTRDTGVGKAVCDEALASRIREIIASRQTTEPA